MNRRIALVAAGLLAAASFLPGTAHAGTVYLMNGEEIDGDVLDVGVDYVVLRVGGGRVSYPLREVRDVEIRPGASIYEKQLKSALERDHAQRQAENEKKRQVEAVRIAPKPIPVPIGNTNITAPPPSPSIDVMRLAMVFDGGERYQFAIRYPAGMKSAEPEMSFLTFKDDTGKVPWSFDVTYFDSSEEADYDLIRARAQGELERIPFYKEGPRKSLNIGRYTAERTTGFYERGSHAIRHDQLVTSTRRGVLVFQFFSPGATLDENAVPDVDAVIASLEVK